MRQTDTVSPRQLIAAAFVALLSPLVRRFPRVTAATAGAAAWLSVPLAIAPLALLVLVLRRLYRTRPLGTGYADILCLALGRGPGRVLTGLYGLWFLTYAGFLLRSGGERFVSTVYPGAAATVFVLVGALLCLPAACGRLSPVARTAMLFRPLMAALFLAVFFLSLKDLDPARLLPVTAADLLPGGLAALQTVNVLSSTAFLAFFSDRLERRFTRRDHAFGWLLAMLAVLMMMTVGCLGVFGSALTQRMTYPYFMLVRDLSVLGTLERAEPVVIALWVLSDFVMVSLLLQAGGKALRFCFGCRDAAAPGKTPALRGGRWLLPLGVAAATALALLLPDSAALFRDLSDVVIPLVNAVFALALPPLTLAVGLLRRRV